MGRAPGDLAGAGLPHPVPAHPSAQEWLAAFLPYLVDRLLAVMDHFLTTEARTLVANVPVRGVRTIYARVGDLFAWLCVTGFALLVVRGAIRRPVS